ncbi:MAG: hypothetical protein ACWA41_07135 [Putridiphycobacter sp.]
MKNLYWFFIFSLIFIGCQSNDEINKTVLKEEVNDKISDALVSEESTLSFPDTINKSLEDEIFDGFEDANFKLDFFCSEGYSTIDRYSYEIIIADSLLITKFNCVLNDSWNGVYFEKDYILDDEELEKIKNKVYTFHLFQKNEGIPERRDYDIGTAYGTINLFIYSDSITIEGGTVYGWTGEDKIMKKERKKSSSIGGDYEGLFIYLESLFPNLPILFKEAKIDSYE